MTLPPHMATNSVTQLDISGQLLRPLQTSSRKAYVLKMVMGDQRSKHCSPLLQLEVLISEFLTVLIVWGLWHGSDAWVLPFLVPTLGEKWQIRIGSCWNRVCNMYMKEWDYGFFGFWYDLSLHRSIVDSLSKVDTKLPPFSSLLSFGKYSLLLSLDLPHLGAYCVAK